MIIRRKVAAAVGVVFALTVLCPPADEVKPAQKGHRVAEYYTTPDVPERRVNAGFVFIGDAGGSIQIRYPQWVILLCTVAFASGVTLLLTRKPDNQ